MHNHRQWTNKLYMPDIKGVGFFFFSFPLNAREDKNVGGGEKARKGKVYM